MNLTFNQTLLTLILLAVLTAPATAGPHDHDDHEEYPTEESHDDHEEGELELEDAAIEKAEITLEKAAPTELTITATLFGKTEPDPQRVSHVKARYSGQIMSVAPSLGDTVKQGQALVVVEANDSLKRYTIKAPIGGTVVDLHANKGEFAGESALMTIADFGKLWAVLSVFPQDADRVTNGQTVTLSAGPRSAQSTIRFLNPGSDSQPTVMAHVPLDNSDGRWTPGLLVQANVVTDTFTVPLAVRNEAIHQFNGERVVFVRNEHGFEVVDVNIGRRDANFSEVTSGLHTGDRYAVGNSYLLKAELEKSSASHDH